MKRKYYLKTPDEALACTLCELTDATYTKEDVTVTDADGGRANTTFYCFVADRKVRKIVNDIKKDIGDELVYFIEPMLRF